MKHDIETFAPGKLYISGEYSVVEGASYALIAPLKTGITCRISKSKHKISTLTSSFYKDSVFTIDLSTGKMQESRPYLSEIFLVMSEFLKAYQVPIHNVDIALSTTLEHPSKGKYGFGSSGAVCVALIRGLLDYFNRPQSNLIVYKLAVLAQYKNYPHSSFGDIACAAYNQTIKYHMVDREWLHINSYSPLVHQLEHDWVNLSVEPLAVDLSDTIIIYTGTPANSQHLVKSLQSHKDDSYYKTFIKKAKNISEAIIASLKTKDHKSLIALFNKHFSIFKDLSVQTGIPFVTKNMFVIESIIHQHHGGMKFSGAGGGDSVIALFHTPQEKVQAMNTLNNHNFKVFTSLLKEL